MSAKTRALLTSFGRVLLGCFITAYTAVAGARLPFDLVQDDWEKIGNAVWGALVVTAYNYVRKGESRFGRGSEDMGMGGTDTVEPPEGKIITPEGPVDPPVEAEVPPEDPDAQEFAEDDAALAAEAEKPAIVSVPLDEVRKAARKRVPKKTTPPAT
jgi:hypothetical protein